jgi:hypothetical protein
LLIAEGVVKKWNLCNDWARLQLLRLVIVLNVKRAMAWATHDNFEKSFKQWRLKALLPEIRPAGTTDPRDKVLALTSFAHDDGRKIVLPDYGFPLAGFYITVAKYWFTSEEDRESNLVKAIYPKNQGPILIGAGLVPWYLKSQTFLSSVMSILPTMVGHAWDLQIPSMAYHRGSRTSALLSKQR